MIPESIPTEDIYGLKLTDEQKLFCDEYVKKYNCRPEKDELMQCREIKKPNKVSSLKEIRQFCTNIDKSTEKEFIDRYVKKVGAMLNEKSGILNLTDIKNNENMEPEKPKVKRRELLKQIESLKNELRKKNDLEVILVSTRNRQILEIESLNVKVKSLNESIALKDAISLEYQNQIEELKLAKCPNLICPITIKYHRNILSFALGLFSIIGMVLMCIYIITNN